MKTKSGKFRLERGALVIAVELFAWVNIAVIAQAQSCGRFTTLSLERQTQVIASHDRSDPECTAYVLKNLGEARHEPAIREILKYMDLEWRGPQLRDDQSHLPPAWAWDGDRFPAFQALYSIGEKSAPAIIDLLGSRDIPALERRRIVVLILGMIQPRVVDDCKGVQALARASRAATDPVVAGRLWRAATEAAAMCGRAACQTALNDPPTK